MPCDLGIDSGKDIIKQQDVWLCIQSARETTRAFCHERFTPRSPISVCLPCVAADQIVHECLRRRMPEKFFVNGFLVPGNIRLDGSRENARLLCRIGNLAAQIACS